MSTIRIPVTVIILTHNEAVNIAECVESLRDFAEIAVVDSGSTDGTLDILCKDLPNVQVRLNPFEDFGQQRNWALDHVKSTHDWILFFDADERCTPQFAAAVDRAVRDPGAHVGFFLCYRNMFLGRWIKRCTMFPSWQLRLLKAGAVRYRKEGHGQREVMEGTAGYIAEPYDHYGFSKGIKEWVARHNEYSTNEVELMQSLARQPVRPLALFSSDPITRRRTLKQLAARAPFRPLVRFVYLYFVRRGFVDGHAGLLFCLLRLAHDIHIQVKLVESARGAPLTSPRSETRQREQKYSEPMRGDSEVRS